MYRSVYRFLYMKAIQVSFDEKLLARLDADPDTKSLGRSAVMRRAVELYLRQKNDRAVADAYRRAYAKDRGRDAELEVWESEAVWPEE